MQIILHLSSYFMLICRFLYAHRVFWHEHMMIFKYFFTWRKFYYPWSYHKKTSFRCPMARKLV